MQNCTILSWSFFVLVMLFSCFGSSENIGMMRLSLLGGLLCISRS